LVGEREGASKRGREEKGSFVKKKNSLGGKVLEENDVRSLFLVEKKIQRTKTEGRKENQ